jgi:acyl CoA:acetate/3-ketoacid CoA transferase beta subunit
MTFEPDLLMTDGIATVLESVDPVSGPKPEPVYGAWMNFRTVFDVVWSGTRHVVMIASQIDRYGNQNFACIGPHAKPKAQLLGMRGAPGNTINHKTSYWVPNHSTRTFVETVDCVSGVGNDRARALGEAGSRFHDLRYVVSNLGVFDFATPDGAMRLVSVHPGVTVDEVVAQTGFELAMAEDVVESRRPTPEELEIMRTFLDPEGLMSREVA